MDLDPSGVDNLSWVRLVWKGLNDICWDTSLVSSGHVCIHYGNFSKNQLREIGMFNTSENHFLLQVNYPMVVATTCYHLPDNSQNSNLLHVQQW